MDEGRNKGGWCDAGLTGGRGRPAAACFLFVRLVWLSKFKEAAGIVLRHILRFAVCIIVSCVVVQSSLVRARQDGSPARVGAQPEGADARRVALYDGMVSFVPPAEFSRMSEEFVAAKFPDAKEPGIVYGNTRTTVSIAITSPPQRMLRPEQLPEFKSFMESFIDRQKKGVQWLRKEFVEVNGQRWIHFEFISQAIDTKIHNHMYLTSMDERMLMFNFNSTVEEYERHKDALEKSKDSIRIEVKK